MTKFEGNIEYTLAKMKFDCLRKRTNAAPCLSKKVA